MGFKLTGFSELNEQLQKLADGSVEIAKKALNEASPILTDEVKGMIARKTTGTGSLADSIEATRAAENSYGVFTVVKPTGRNRSGERNGAVMAYLEYGTHNKDGSLRMQARPIMTPSVRAAEDKCLRKMEEVVNREIEKVMK